MGLKNIIKKIKAQNLQISPILSENSGSGDALVEDAIDWRSVFCWLSLQMIFLETNKLSELEFLVKPSPTDDDKMLEIGIESSEEDIDMLLEKLIISHLSIQIVKKRVEIYLEENELSSEIVSFSKSIASMKFVICISLKNEMLLPEVLLLLLISSSILFLHELSKDCSFDFKIFERYCCKIGCPTKS